MKKILIKSAQIVSETSSFNGKEVNVVIENGKINYIGADEPDADKVIDAEGMYLTSGWFDMRAHLADPGFEHKEDLDSGAATAAAGGFTGVAILPNNAPVTQTKNDVKYIKGVHHDCITEFFPIAAVTKNTKGEELTEMVDLHHAGAVAFSDGLIPIWHTDIVLKTLQYLQKFDGLLINKPEDIHLNMFGVMNEGVNSTMLGMKGMPNLAEEIIIKRDVDLLGYAGGKIHFANISTAKSVELIKAAKEKGLNVTCDIASYQTDFNDDALMDFDSNYKVNPPFRTDDDNQALIAGLKEGVIDVLVSSHVPHDEECKKLEYDLADFGIIGLQTVAHNIAKLMAYVDIETLIKAVTTNPRNILNISSPVIEMGEYANLTLFDPKFEWSLNSKTNLSKSQNSPYWNKAIHGKTLATFNKEKVYLDEAL